MSIPNNARVYKNEKVMLRMAIGLIALAGLFALIRWLLENGRDPDFQVGNSTGMVAAIEYKPDGQEMVLIDDKGTKTAVPGWKDGNIDENPVWRPDGQRLFFTSDRDGTAFNIYRYRPTASGAEKRSLGKRSKGKPWFGPVGHPDANKTGLIASGASVMEFSPKEGTTRQLLPPPTGQAAGSEERGVQDQVALFYQNLGQAFIEARWGPDRNSIIATLQNEELQLLISQNMNSTDKGIETPIVFEYGRKIEFDVAPTGEMVVINNGFEFPPVKGTESELEAYKAYIKDGKLVKPYLSAMFTINLNNPGERKVLFASKDGKQTAMSPVLSPDGKSFVFQIGTMDDSDNFTSQGLLMLSSTADSMENATVVSRSPAYEPAWAADSSKIYYITKSEGKRNITIFDVATGTESFLARGTGDYAFPVPSPMLPK